MDAVVRAPGVDLELLRTYSSAGEISSEFGPHAANRLVATTTPRGNEPGTDPADFTTTYAYDPAGNLTAVSDPTGAVTLTEFDESNRPVTVTGPLGEVTQYGYDAADNLISTTDPTGAVYGQTVDPNGRLIATTDPLGNTTSYGHDPDGLQISQISPVGNETTWSFDPDGRVVSITDPRGNVTGADPADFTTLFEYDQAGNQVAVTDPLGRSVTSEYDAANRLTTMVDPAEQAISYTYDAVGNLTQVTAAGGGVTSYDYDTAGRLATLTNPKGGSYSYAHDPAGRVASVTTPEGREVSYGYNADGQPETVTVPLGSISYTYDPLGRTTGVTYSDPSPPLAYTYDAAGRLATASNGVTTAEYAYDPAGRVTGITRGGQVLGYQWDPAGRLVERSFPDGRAQSYAWGDDSRLAGTTLTPAAGSGAGTHSVSYTYDPAGNLVEAAHQGALAGSSSYSYNAAGQVTQLAHTSSAHVLVEQNIEWTAAGPPGVVSTARGSDTVTSIYTYDDAGQVTGVCLSGDGETCGAADTQVEYDYDLNGNRTSSLVTGGGDSTTTTSTYDADDRPTGEVANGIPTTLSYDANGHLASVTGPDGTRTYTYGLDGNLYGVQLEVGQAIGYTYDESGNRISRTVDTAADATWTWDTLGLPTRLDELDGTGAVRHQWWPDPQADLGAALADTAGGGFTWLLGDYQGTVTDVAGTTLTGSATLDPFGEPLSSSGDYETNPLRFHGQYLDETTGLYDLRARDYQAGSGRFTGPDPVAAATGTPFVNTYHYGYNQPTVLTDPTGECAIICTAIIGAVAGAAIGGIDCWLSGDDASTCLAKIGTGAAFGALAGATMGASAAAGLGAWGMAGTSAVVGGLEYAGYNSTVAYSTGQPYGWSNAGQDLAIGTAGGLAGAGVGEAAARAARLGIDCLPTPTQTGRAAGQAGPGAWGPGKNHGSPRAQAYEEQVTGMPVTQSYYVNGREFDGFVDGVLIEAKGPGFAWAVQPNGMFRGTYRGADEMVDQARNQQTAARGWPIRWVVAEPETAVAIRNLFEDRGIVGIEVVHVPPR